MDLPHLPEFVIPIAPKDLEDPSTPTLTPTSLYDLSADGGLAPRLLDEISAVATKRRAMEMYSPDSLSASYALIKPSHYCSFSASAQCDIIRFLADGVASIAQVASPLCSNPPPKPSHHPPADPAHPSSPAHNDDFTISACRNSLKMWVWLLVRALVQLKPTPQHLGEVEHAFLSLSKALSITDVDALWPFNRVELSYVYLYASALQCGFEHAVLFRRRGPHGPSPTSKAVAELLSAYVTHATRHVEAAFLPGLLAGLLGRPTNPHLGDDMAEAFILVSQSRCGASAAFSATVSELVACLVNHVCEGDPAGGADDADDAEVGAGAAPTMADKAAGGDARHIAGFFSAVANLAPALLLKDISQLGVALASPTALVRSAVLDYVGALLMVVLVDGVRAGEPQLTPREKDLRVQMFELILRHFVDVHWRVRWKALRVLAAIERKGCVPLAVHAAVLTATALRVNDKASPVRRAAMELVTTFVQDIARGMRLDPEWARRLLDTTAARLKAEFPVDPEAEATLSAGPQTQVAASQAIMESQQQTQFLTQSQAMTQAQDGGEWGNAGDVGRGGAGARESGSGALVAATAPSDPAARMRRFHVAKRELMYYAFIFEVVASLNHCVEIAGDWLCSRLSDASAAVELVMAAHHAGATAARPLYFRAMALVQSKQGDVARKALASFTSRWLPAVPGGGGGAGSAANAKAVEARIRRDVLDCEVAAPAHLPDLEYAIGVITRSLPVGFLAAIMRVVSGTSSDDARASLRILSAIADADPTLVRPLVPQLIAFLEARGLAHCEVATAALDVMIRCAPHRVGRDGAAASATADAAAGAAAAASISISGRGRGAVSQSHRQTNSRSSAACATAASVTAAPISAKAPVVAALLRAIVTRLPDTSWTFPPPSALHAAAPPPPRPDPASPAGLQESGVCGGWPRFVQMALRFFFEMTDAPCVLARLTVGTLVDALARANADLFSAERAFGAEAAFTAASASSHSACPLPSASSSSSSSRCPTDSSSRSSSADSATSSSADSGNALVVNGGGARAAAQQLPVLAARVRSILLRLFVVVFHTLHDWALWTHRTYAARRAAIANDPNRSRGESASAGGPAGAADKTAGRGGARSGKGTAGGRGRRIPAAVAAVAAAGGLGVGGGESEEEDEIAQEIGLSKKVTAELALDDEEHAALRGLTDPAEVMGGLLPTVVAAAFGSSIGVRALEIVRDAGVQVPPCLHGVFQSRAYAVVLQQPYVRTVAIRTVSAYMALSLPLAERYVRPFYSLLASPHTPADALLSVIVLSKDLLELHPNAVSPWIIACIFPLLNPTPRRRRRRPRRRGGDRGLCSPRSQRAARGVDESSGSDTGEERSGRESNSSDSSSSTAHTSSSSSSAQSDSSVAHPTSRAAGSCDATSSSSPAATASAPGQGGAAAAVASRHWGREAIAALRTTALSFVAEVVLSDLIKARESIHCIARLLVDPDPALLSTATSFFAALNQRPGDRVYNDLPHILSALAAPPTPSARRTATASTTTASAATDGAATAVPSPDASPLMQEDGEVQANTDAEALAKAATAAGAEVPRASAPTMSVSDYVRVARILLKYVTKDRQCENLAVRLLAHLRNAHRHTVRCIVSTLPLLHTVNERALRRVEPAVRHLGTAVADARIVKSMGQFIARGPKGETQAAALAALQRAVATVSGEKEDETGGLDGGKSSEEDGDDRDSSTAKRPAAGLVENRPRRAAGGGSGGRARGGGGRGGTARGRGGRGTTRRAVRLRVADSDDGSDSEAASSSSADSSSTSSTASSSSS